MAARAQCCHFVQSFRNVSQSLSAKICHTLPKKLAHFVETVSLTAYSFSYLRVSS